MTGKPYSQINAPTALEIRATVITDSQAASKIGTEGTTVQHPHE
jgi:hypothetical protein